MSFITLSKLHGHDFDYQLMLHNTSRSPLDTRCLYSVHVEQVSDIGYSGKMCAYLCNIQYT